MGVVRESRGALFRPLGFLLDARALAARMSSVEESRKRSLHAEKRQAQYRKRYKENLESCISTLERDVSKWKAIAKELQVFLDSFFSHYIGILCRHKNLHFPLFMPIILRSKS
jgi:hypothetical protein